MTELHKRDKTSEIVNLSKFSSLINKDLKIVEHGAIMNINDSILNVFARSPKLKKSCT